jgi:hypothetical protein
VKSNRLLPGLFLLGFLATSFSEAQFVRFSRCHAAYPCLMPFGIQYNPDPLIAGQYGQPNTTAISGHIELKFPMKVEIDKPIDQKAIDEAVRKTLEFQPAEKKPAATPPAEVAPAPEDVKPKAPPGEH